MAPVTRRRSREAHLSSQEASIAPVVSSDVPIPSDASFEAVATIAEKRKTATDGEDQDSVEDSERTSPKRQKLAVRVREEENVSGSGRSVRIDAKLLSQKSKRTRSSSIADSQDDVEEEEDPTPQSASKQLQEEASQHLSQDHLAADSAANPTPVPTARTSKHVVFDDDEDVDKFVAAASELPKPAMPAAVEDEDESDDEAPEAVSTSAAARDTLKSAHALSKVADKQAALLKRKRQERDNLFKQQAEKRKRVEKPEVHQSKRRKEHSAGLSEDADANEVAEVEKATTASRRRAEKVKLPTMLPAEFLTDSESGSEDERALKVARKPKKIKFEEAVQTLSNEGKAPRDQIVGSTAYRVMAEEGNKSLAPKAHKNTKNVKDFLMRRRRVGVTPAKAKGFFRRK